MSQQTVLGVSLKGTLSSTSLLIGRPWQLTAVMGVVVYPDGVHLMCVTYEKNDGGGGGGAADICNDF